MQSVKGDSSSQTSEIKNQLWLTASLNARKDFLTSSGINAVWNPYSILKDFVIRTCVHKPVVKPSVVSAWVVCRGADGAIFSSHEYVKEKELSVQFHLHRKLYAGVVTVHMIMKGVNQVRGHHVFHQKPLGCIEGRLCLLLHLLHDQVCDHYWYRWPHHSAVDLSVYFALKGQVDGLQVKLQKGADVVHGEAASVRKRCVIHQLVTGNLDGSEGWHMSKKKHYIKIHYDFWARHILGWWRTDQTAVSSSCGSQKSWGWVTAQRQGTWKVHMLVRTQKVKLDGGGTSGLWSLGHP